MRVVVVVVKWELEPWGSRDRRRARQYPDNRNQKKEVQ